MHPDDVAREGWSEGMQVTIKSRVGAITAELSSSTEVMPGVISLPHGYGHGLQRHALRGREHTCGREL